MILQKSFGAQESFLIINIETILLLKIHISIKYCSFELTIYQTIPKKTNKQKKKTFQK